eukprot:5009715-Prymnesium_polylepis.1
MRFRCGPSSPPPPSGSVSTSASASASPPPPPPQSRPCQARLRGFVRSTQPPPLRYRRCPESLSCRRSCAAPRIDCPEA